MSARAMSRQAQAERRAQIAQAYERGLTSREVAELFDTSSGHVRDVIKLYGVSRPVGRPSSRNKWVGLAYLDGAEQGGSAVNGSPLSNGGRR